MGDARVEVSGDLGDFVYGNRDRHAVARLLGEQILGFLYQFDAFLQVLERTR